MPKKPQSRRANTRVAVVADVHIHNYKAFGDLTRGGINQRGEMSIDAFVAAMDRAVELGCSKLFVAGDLFHVRRPEPALLSAVIREIGEVREKLQVVIIPGNHDMIEAGAEGGNTAVAPLHREALVIKSPIWVENDNLSCLCVPFAAGKPVGMFLREAMAATVEKTPKTQYRALIAHAGVYDDTSPGWMKEAKDSIHVADLQRLLYEYKFTDAFVGHYHQHRIWEDPPTVVQVGTLCPGGFSDQGAFPWVGGMAVYDGETIDMEQIKGPRFLELKAEQQVPEELRGWYPLFLRVVGDKVTVPDNFPSDHVEKVEAPPADVEASDTPDVKDAPEALRSYIEKMPLPASVDRARVLEVVLAVWGESEV